MNKTVFFNKFRRLFGFVLTISLLGNVFAASAQNARISIKMENVPISQVIKEIENQTRYLFINKGVDTKNKVVSTLSKKRSRMCWHNCSPARKSLTGSMNPTLS